MGDFLRHIRVVSLGFDLGQHRIHGEQGQKQGDSDQYDVRRGLLRTQGGTQKGEGDDVPGKGGHHHHDGGQQGDDGGQKQDFQRLNIFSVDIDQALGHCFSPLFPLCNFSNSAC